uniref:Uncharacterized protein n=1 Tax=Florenciella parvula TaxID=236787 RepID=A0A7S2B7B5_9STRA|mmetsp:Transcript_13547/g.28599  ORF Transcript_13547/g.28599 Transcript_13547/m.28599 type:complete len:326 (+) Transcript_13547:196-1173(+)|eukprot:CAMPEP_0182546286 /NCGR_PEP_ID=MMETSP1323-20130603/35819_1 /TAXON_ID=236787 /ORGANISM="Florenciella parvula, Strain RCC1693" /LENGTH=325 /DNA_ID=CAMNT_0024757499 /DNA_START=176 /DNA_END=1153 /DNA_ORIENTATION=-
MWAFRRGAGAYTELLRAQPLLTNSVTASGLYGGGDLVAQAIEMKLKITSPNKEKVNWNRTMRMTVFGMGVAGPLLTGWYPLLHRMTLPFRQSYTEVAPALARNVNIRSEWYTMETLSGPMNRAREVGAKVLFDTVFFQAPYLTCYFFVTGFLEGRTPAAVFKKTKDNFHASWFYGTLLWAPAQTLNFMFVPVMFQPLVVHSVDVVWKASLSVLYHYRDYGPAFALTSKHASLDRTSAEVIVASQPSSSELAQPPSEMQGMMEELEELRREVKGHRAMLVELDALRREVRDHRETIAQFHHATRRVTRSFDRLTRGDKSPRAPGGR